MTINSAGSINHCGTNLIGAASDSSAWKSQFTDMHTKQTSLCNLDLVGMQEVRWDKGGAEPGDSETF
jgi:hypothetical protein